MMVKRNTVNKANFEKFKNSEGRTLSEVIDKGFPYDDADFELTGAINSIKKMPVGAVLGQLNGENITKEALVNLIKDRSSPVTQSFLQIGSKKGDTDNLSSLFDTNVTRGALKNLVTDKPAPITVKLAQQKKGDVDVFASLFDTNVTRGALKNLVTDKPAPITVKLA